MDFFFNTRQTSSNSLQRSGMTKGSNELSFESRRNLRDERHSLNSNPKMNSPNFNISYASILGNRSSSGLLKDKYSRNSKSNLVPLNINNSFFNEQKSARDKSRDEVQETMTNMKINKSKGSILMDN